MAERSILIPSEDFLLEALYEPGREDEPNLVALCHPHPAYGGNMENNVVVAMRNVFRAHGWSTLRFNFRGVGRSGGTYGNGEGETEDLLAVASYFLRQDRRKLHLGGYSFGAWIVLRAIQSSLEAASLVLVSPPIDFLDFNDFGLPQNPCLITLGDRDSFCTKESLENWFLGQPDSGIDWEYQFIAQCDHFYWGREGILSEKIAQFIGKYFPPGAAE